MDQPSIRIRVSPATGYEISVPRSGHLAAAGRRRRICTRACRQSTVENSISVLRPVLRVLRAVPALADGKDFAQKLLHFSGFLV